MSLQKLDLWGCPEVEFKGGRTSNLLDIIKMNEVNGGCLFAVMFRIPYVDR